MRIAIAVIAYESEGFIGQLLDRIPDSIHGHDPVILLSDDASTDGTFAVAERWIADNHHRTAKAVQQATNHGYGGNQKVVYKWAAEEGADVVVLLHGDEQYPPERIADLVAPILDGRADATFGSRMSTRGAARAGGMPFSRYVGNIVLSLLLNRCAGTRLSEWFSGFRAYHVGALEQVGLAGLPDGFDFDIAVTLRLLDHDLRIAEIPIPTHYGDEVSRVPRTRISLTTVGHGVRSYRRRRAGTPAAAPSGLLPRPADERP